jgi:predicted TIM-barrel fold metal-dependent hydrolase
MMPPLLKKGGYNEAQYDRIWAALCDANLPVVFHAGTGKEPRTATGHGGAIINYVVHAMNTVVQPVVELCSSGVFDRYPKLKFSTIEAGAGWLPYTLQAMDFGCEAFAFWVSPTLKYKPSEYFQMHGHASFEIDDVAIASRERIGTQCLMWGNDYPHIEGCWPYSAEQVDKWTKMGVTEAEKRDILGLNASRLFNIPVPARFL